MLPGIRESVRNTWLTICGRRIPMPPSYCIFFPNVRWDNRRETRPELAAFNASCREAAKKKGIILVDYSVEFNKIYDAGGEEALKPYQRDGILPTRKAAQEILVPMLWDAILGRDSAKK